MMTIGEEAVGLLEDLPIPWEAAALAQQRKLLLTMLDAVYVDTVDEKTIVAIRHKAVFCPLLENAMTLVGNGVALKKNQTQQAHLESGASESRSWWRRGRIGAGLRNGSMVLVAERGPRKAREPN